MKFCRAWFWTLCNIAFYYVTNRANQNAWVWVAEFEDEKRRRRVVSLDRIKERKKWISAKLRRTTSVCLKVWGSSYYNSPWDCSVEKLREPSQQLPRVWLAFLHCSPWIPLLPVVVRVLEKAWEKVKAMIPFSSLQQPQRVHKYFISISRG